MKLSGLFRPVLVLASVVALAVAAGGCDNTPVTPSSPEYSQTDLLVGTGAEAVSGSVVVVRYTGWFYDINKTDKKGLVFDTTVGKSPLVFQLGSGSVITGWDKGVVGMKVGGQRRLVLPPSDAYGANRYASIPPNATLIFDIELVGISVTPTISGIEPASGPTGGGTTVTITGTEFTSGFAVTIGGAAATNVTLVSSTKLTATTPAHTAGAVDVVVINPEGLSATLAGGYTYVVPTSAAAGR